MGDSRSQRDPPGLSPHFPTPLCGGDGGGDRVGDGDGGTGNNKKHLSRAHTRQAPDRQISSDLHISFHLLIRTNLRSKSDYPYFQKELKLRGERLWPGS